MKKEPPFIRLYREILKDGACWIWTGAVGSSGYGQIKAFGKLVQCHRLSFELYHGPIPEGMEVMHTCDRRTCINPHHLIAGTHRDNMQDMAAKGRRRIGKQNPRKGIRNSQSRPVMVLGKAYGSIKEAEKALSLGAGSVRYWINNRPDKARAISREEYLRITNHGE